LLSPLRAIISHCAGRRVFGLLASRRLVRRVRRLERYLAVADGDYTSPPPSPPDRVDGWEANFTTMARQLGSALEAERHAPAPMRAPR